MVTQRPPEVSGSKNALAIANMTNANRGRNTTLMTGTGPDQAMINNA